MALIKCPECKKKISDQCTNCPNCGYPLDKICEADENQTTDIANSNEETTKIKKSFEIKALIKKWWFWVTIGVVIAAIATTTILLLNRDTKPKFDKEGNPIFVELTNEVYTNAKKYKGYHINIKGKVFQVMSDNGKVKGIQVWLDPDTCEQNMMIYYNTDVEVKQGDYIIGSGYIDSVTEYKNAYDAKLYAPLVISSDLRKATYIEVMAPTIAKTTPENLKQEKFGYSVSIDKIEFAEKETRVYTTVTNNGKALLYFGDSVIVQEGKQYNSTDNYEAEYEKIPYEVLKGVSCSGIIVFPAITTNDFELTIDIHSDDFDEEMEKFTFKITKDTIVAEEPREDVKQNQTTSNSTNTPSGKILFNGGVCSHLVSPNNGTPPDNKTEFINGEQICFTGKFSGFKGEYAVTVLATFPDGTTHTDKFKVINNDICGYGWVDCGIGIGNFKVLLDSTGETLGFYEFIIYENEIPTALEPADYAKALYKEGYNREEIIQDIINGEKTRTDAEKIVDTCGIDWNAEALKAIKNILIELPPSQTFYSPNDLKEDYDMRPFSESQKEYAIQNSGVNWNIEVVEVVGMLDLNLKLWEYEKYHDHLVKKDEMIYELKKRGFTETQAKYGVDNCNIDWSSRE